MLRPQLIPRAVREGPPGHVLHARLHDGDEVAQRLGAELAVAAHPLLRLGLVEQRLEHAMFHPHDHVAEHGDETAIGIVGKARVAGGGAETLHRLVVEADVENRIHHARHGLAGARAYRQQQRVVRPAKRCADRALDASQGRQHLVPQAVGVAVAQGVVGQAGFGGQGEARRHANAQRGHVGKPGALAAQQAAGQAVGALAFGRAVGKQVNVFLVRHYNSQVRRGCRAGMRRAEPAPPTRRICRR